VVEPAGIGQGDMGRIEVVAGQRGFFVTGPAAISMVVARDGSGQSVTVTLGDRPS
jgi:hypothetical protein